MEQTRKVVCPYCSQTFYLFVDISAGDQEYIEDCQVCCQPIGFRIRIEDGEIEEIQGYAAN
ncbi:MAG TPA: CPXCG motif-containing cysteine-rich protein [Terriglobia bacterium]|jgi:Cysteine-rich CPXCG|nr:CPXCG motif-containing cysteine-rich protein [Terriglobia bacterium]